MPPSSAEHAVLAIAHSGGLPRGCRAAQSQSAVERQGATQDLAAKRCAKAGHQLPATLEKTDAGFRLDVNGMASKAKKPTLKDRLPDEGQQGDLQGPGRQEGRAPAQGRGQAAAAVRCVSPADAETSVPAKVTFDMP